MLQYATVSFSISFSLSLILSKGDFDGAIAQYKLTIGTLEPSYVIRKV